MDIKWTIEVQVPQLTTLDETIKTLGAQLMDYVVEIKDTMIRLEESQLATAQALTDQVTIIANEVSEWTPQTVTEEQLKTLHTHLVRAAEASEAHTAQIRANTEQIKGIVPDPPPPA